MALVAGVGGAALFAVAALVSGALASGALAVGAPPAEGAEQSRVYHVHGLAYLPGPGKRLVIATHSGLMMHDGTRWSLFKAPPHEYMSLAVSDKTLYASGGPAPGSDLPAPLGLAASTDGGKSFRSVALGGSTALLFMSAGYHSGVVYVLVTEPTPATSSPGIYRSTDLGQSLQGVPLAGITGVRAFAAHPYDAGSLAVAGDDGIYLTQDAGRSYRRIALAERPRMVAFSTSGDRLWYGGFDAQTYLRRIALAAESPGRDETPEELPLPDVGRTSLAYLTQDPRRPETLALATLVRDILVTQDGGRHWKFIAHGGKLE